MAPSIISTANDTSLLVTATKAPELVAPEPEHCPGPESEAAGKADACAGCPNQEICASAPKGPDPDIPIIAEHLLEVKHKVLVLSGKGGVGKSTFSAMLAQAFASQDDYIQDGEEREITVGLMDTDICGPSIPRVLLGTDAMSSTVHTTSAGWSPIWASDNLCVMSIQFLLPDPNAAIIWRGPKKNGMIKRFLRDVEWGSLDLLLVDTPPGTSDEHLSMQSFLNATGVDGAILVTTPQEVALGDVRRELDFCRKAGIPVLGVVENMAGFVCPNCKFTSNIFNASSGGGRRFCNEEGIQYLGAVPLDPRIGLACDLGESFLDAYPESPAVKSIMEVVNKVGKVIGLKAAVR